MCPGYRKQLVGPVGGRRHRTSPGNRNRLGGQRTHPVKFEATLAGQRQGEIKTDHRPETRSVHRVEPRHGELRVFLGGTGSSEQAQRRGRVVGDLDRMKGVETRPGRSPLFHGNHVGEIVGEIERARGTPDITERSQRAGFLTDQPDPHRTRADIPQPVPSELQGHVRTTAVELGDRPDLAGGPPQRAVTGPLPGGKTGSGQSPRRIDLAQLEGGIGLQDSGSTSDNTQPAGIGGGQGVLGELVQAAPQPDRLGNDMGGRGVLVGAEQFGQPLFGMGERDLRGRRAENINQVHGLPVGEERAHHGGTGIKMKLPAVGRGWARGCHEPTHGKLPGRGGRPGRGPVSSRTGVFGELGIHPARRDRMAR